MKGSRRTRRWFKRDPDRWANEQSLAALVLYNSSACTRGGVARIVGTYPLRSAHGHLLGEFKVRIVFPSGFPHRGVHPSIYLVSHRDVWSNGLNSHIENDWRLCLYVPHESGIDFTNTRAMLTQVARLDAFLRCERVYQKDLREARANGLDVEKVAWPGPDRSHGIIGLVEAIEAIGHEPSPEDPCACGREANYDRCCGPRVQALREALRAERQQAFARAVNAARPKVPTTWSGRDEHVGEPKEQKEQPC